MVALDGRRAVGAGFDNIGIMVPWARYLTSGKRFASSWKTETNSCPINFRFSSGSKHPLALQEIGPPH